MAATLQLSRPDLNVKPVPLRIGSPYRHAAGPALEGHPVATLKEMQVPVIHVLVDSPDVAPAITRSHEVDLGVAARALHEYPRPITLGVEFALGA